MQGERQVKVPATVGRSLTAQRAEVFAFGSEQKPAGKIIKFGTNIDLSDPKK